MTNLPRSLSATENIFLSLIIKLLCTRQHPHFFPCDSIRRTTGSISCYVIKSIILILMEYRIILLHSLMCTDSLSFCFFSPLYIFDRLLLPPVLSQSALLLKICLISAAPQQPSCGLRQIIFDVWLSLMPSCTAIRFSVRLKKPLESPGNILKADRNRRNKGDCFHKVLITLHCGQKFFCLQFRDRLS